MKKPIKIEKQPSIKEIKESMPITKLSVTRYTYETWKKCYPNGNKWEWMRTTCPYNILDFVEQVCEDNEIEDMPVKVVMIDEEYFDWLGDRENTPSVRAEYATTVSDEDALRLLQKNKMDNDVAFRFLPIAVTRYRKFEKEEHFMLSLEERKRLGEEIGKIIEGDIKVLPYMIPITDLINDEQDELDEYMNKVVLNVPVNPPEKYKTQHYDGNYNLDLLCVPAILSQKVKSATIDFNDTSEDFERFLFPELEDCSEIEIPENILGENTLSTLIGGLFTMEELPMLAEEFAEQYS